MDIPRHHICYHESRDDNQLDAELDDADQHVGHGNDQSRKIHLPEQMRICDERVGVCHQTRGKYSPRSGRDKVEQNSRDSCSSNLSHITEQEHVYETGDHRIEDDPERPEKGLLIRHGKCLAGHQPNQVPVLPELLQPEMKPFFKRRQLYMVRSAFFGDTLHNRPILHVFCLSVDSLPSEKGSGCNRDLPPPAPSPTYS